MTDFIYRTKWSKADIIAAFGAFLVVLWVCVPSRFFLQPVALSINVDSTMVTFFRKTPYGEVQARWASEIRSASCQKSASGGPTPYEDVWPKPANPYPLSDLAVCLPVNEPFEYQVAQRVMVFGLIPLRPVKSVWFCPAGGGDCKLQK